MSKEKEDKKLFRSHLLTKKPPMIEYEAMLLNGNDKLVGPIYLLDTNHMPSSWRVFQHGNEAKQEESPENMISKKPDPSQLLAQSKSVLTVVTRCRKNVPKPPSPLQLIQKNAYRLCNQDEIEIYSSDINPCFPNNRGPFIANHNEWNDEICGLAGFGKTIENAKLSECFGKGLNLIGRCGNTSCDRQPTDKIWKHGFQPLRVDRDTFTCPACFHKTFRLTNFLFSGARAIFRVKRTDEEMERSFTIQSGPFPEYIKFKRNLARVAYDFIEINTEGWELYSKYGITNCVLCCGQIDFANVSQDGCHYLCGHPYHRTCLQAMNNSCPVCCIMMVSHFAVQDH